MNERPSVINLMKVIKDQDMVAEEAIAIIDKESKCAVTHDELVAFLEKWAKKKHQKLSEKSRKFADRAYDFIDDNHDGVIDPFELHYAMNEIVEQYGDMGEKAEDVYAFF